MAASSDRPWTGEAFGLGITSAVSLPGLVRGRATPGRRPLTIDIDPRLEPSGGERVVEWRDPAGDVGLVIEAGERGFWFEVRGAGRYELSADGRRVRCAPAPDAGFSWRRYLIGQVLPFAALLQGLEVFHASAVALDGEVIALAAGTGAGKSTLALNLHLEGAAFVTDDVLAVEVVDDTPLVHPGLGVAKVRRAATDLVDPAGLGTPVTSDPHELRYLVEAAPHALPLRTFCVLDRAEDDVVRLSEPETPAFRLLASTFNLVVGTPERLAAQLSVCAVIARHARVLTAAIPDRPDERTAAQLRALLIGARLAA